MVFGTIGFCCYRSSAIASLPTPISMPSAVGWKLLLEALPRTSRPMNWRAWDGTNKLHRRLPSPMSWQPGLCRHSRLWIRRRTPGHGPLDLWSVKARHYIRDTGTPGSGSGGCMRMVSTFLDRRRESGGIISFGWIGKRGSILGYVEYLKKKLASLIIIDRNLKSLTAVLFGGSTFFLALCFILLRLRSNT